MAAYPALDVRGVEPDFVLAAVDDFGPSAAELHDDGVTIFFTEAGRRDQAREAVAAAFPKARVSAHGVDDGDWARRSQQALGPVTVGRLTVAPPWAPPAPSGSLQPDAVSVVILPSMGFGTGHHATTRLCLAALQDLDLRERLVLDVGTGSGVLALAARRLGAASALGTDYDVDAIASANENLDLNPDIDHVRFVVADLEADEPLPRAPVVTANLTGAQLVRSATELSAALEPGGSLVVSGLMVEERAAVVAAFAGLRLAREAREDEWLCLTFTRLV